jgi:hypothetical protein
VAAPPIRINGENARPYGVLRPGLSLASDAALPASVAREMSRLLDTIVYGEITMSMVVYGAAAGR